MIVLENIQRTFPNTSFSLRIQQETVRPGEKLAITGKSGSGKTTLLNLLSGILLPDSGRVQVGEVEVSRLSEDKRRDFRIQKVGMAFQGFELLDYLSVRDNIMLAYRMSASLGLTAEVRARADMLAELTGLGDKLERNAQTLSQGERQRASICRALLPQPELILADEPTANLDFENTANVFDIIFEYLKVSGATFICATHERELVGRFDRELNIDHLS